MDIEMSPRKILIVLLSIIGFLLFANIMGIVSRYVFDHDMVYGLVPLFNFDNEKNVPTLYSSLQFIIASLLLLIIGANHKSNGESHVFWLALAVIFLFLAIDETASLHEKLASPFRETFGTSGLLHFAWIIPYAIAVLVFVIVFSKFLFRLPRGVMLRFIASGRFS